MLVKLIDGNLILGGKTLKCTKTLTRKVPEISYINQEITTEEGETIVVKQKVVTYHDEEYTEDVIIVNPREEDFISAGYKHLVSNTLEEKEGYYQVPVYTEEDDKIIANYYYQVLEEEFVEGV